MVAADVKQIRGRDLDRIRNEGLAHPPRRVRPMAKVFESDLAEKFIELVVGTNPEPLDDITLAIADCANV